MQLKCMRLASENIGMPTSMHRGLRSPGSLSAGRLRPGGPPCTREKAASHQRVRDVFARTPRHALGGSQHGGRLPRCRREASRPCKPAARREWASRQSTPLDPSRHFTGTSSRWYGGSVIEGSENRRASSRFTIVPPHRRSLSPCEANFRTRFKPSYAAAAYHTLLPNAALPARHHRCKLPHGHGVAWFALVSCSFPVQKPESFYHQQCGSFFL